MVDRVRLDSSSRELRPVREASQDCLKAHDLLDRHQATGGCYTVHALALELKCSARRAAGLLDRWTSSRCILLMPMAPEALLPVYQLDLEKGAPRPAIQKVVDELADVFSDVELAEWFVTPNLWLADRTPAELVSEDARAVLGAARADRFVARG